MGKNKKWSPSQKFEIALMAMKNEMTINDTRLYFSDLQIDFPLAYV